MAQINGISVGIDGDLSGFNRAMADLSKRLDKLEGDFKKPSQAAGGFDDAINGLQNKLLAFASIDFAIGIGKQILDTTAEFQKLQAVLANTLGSQEQGAIAFAKIGDFAAKTNFSVLELTDSYVKLANQGFKPTAAQLENLADLANSTGKSFDQLTEAIIDAQTGEFERLKEFGIRASKEGDKVKFSFKGVETQVNFTNDAIRDYIVGLGDLNGVQGSTAAISETLGGRISNLGDAIDTLFNTIGSKGNGVMGGFIALLTEGIGSIEQFIAGEEELIRRAALKELANQGENFGKTIDEVAQNYIRAGKTADEARKLSEQWLKGEAIANIKKYQDEIVELDKKIKQLTSQTGVLGKATDILGIGNLDQAKKDRVKAEGELAKFKQQIDYFNKTGAFAVKVPIKTEDESAKKLQDQIAKILADTEAKLKSSAVQARIFGEEQGLLAKQTGILESSIRSLTDLGLTPQSAAVQKLVTQYRALGATDLSKLKESLQGVTDIKPIGTAQDGTLDSSIFNLPAPKIDIPKDAFDSLDQFSDGAAERLRGIQENFAEYSQSLPNQVAGMFAGMADAATQGLGEFAEAIGRGEDAKDALKKLVGGLASQLGSNLISLGTPLLLLPGFQGQGAAYLAAGLALKLLAGTLGAGAGKGGSSASGSQVARAEPKTGFAGGSGSDFQGSATRATQDAVRANERAQGSTQMTMIVEVTGRLTGEGSTLVAIIDKARAKQEKTGG